MSLTSDRLWADCGRFARRLSCAPEAELRLVGPTIRSIRERVKAGLERARANGKILGRPRTDPRVEAKIRRLAGQGMGKGRVARTLGIGVSVAQRVLAS
jgi:hypothetical protein